MQAKTFACLGAAGTLALCGSAAAQSVTISVTPVTAYTVTATSAGQTTSSAVPAGIPAQLAGIATGSIASSEASSQWLAFSFDTETVFDSSITTTVSGLAAGATATKDLSDLIVELQAPTPTAIDIEVSHILSPSHTASVLTWRVDIGDDGVIDFDELSAPAINWTVGPYIVGPQPLRIRITTELAQTQTGSTSLAQRIRALPHNGLTIDPAFPACGEEQMSVVPCFAGTGIALQAALGGNPIFAVLGLDLQPLLLPSALPAPCLLLPRPDFVAYLPPTAPLLLLPLPAAVRPVTLWAQGIGLTPNGLSVTDGKRILAQ